MELIKIDLEVARDYFTYLEDVGHYLREPKCITNSETSMKNDGHGQRGVNTYGYGGFGEQRVH